MEKKVYVQENVDQLEPIEKLRRQIEDLTTEKENLEQNYIGLVASLQEKNYKQRQELEQLEKELRLKNDLIQDLQRDLGNPVVVQKHEKHITPPRSETEKTPVQETREGVEELERINVAQKQETEQQRKKTKQFKDECQQLAAVGRVCWIDCLLCVIHWIYLIILRMDPVCNRMLEKVIMREAKEIKDEEVNCGRFMNILKTSGIVSNGKYIYEVNSRDDNNSKREKAKEAWKILMAWPMNEKVCILGNMRDDGAGHCWAVDLKSRNNNKIMIHDPQNGLVHVVSEELFVQLVTEPESKIQLLMMYTVDLKQMEQIYEKNKGIFKKSELDHLIFINRAASVATKYL